MHFVKNHLNFFQKQVTPPKCEGGGVFRCYSYEYIAILKSEYIKKFEGDARNI